MDQLQVKRDFNNISQEFLSNHFGLDTVAHLIAQIRYNLAGLSNSQIQKLLEIPINILKQDVVLKDPKDFQTHAAYFRGNMGSVVKDQFFQSFLARYNKGELTLDDMIAYTEYIRDHLGLCSSEFLFRNIEVTIRDFVQLAKPSNFSRSGQVFADQINRIIGI